MVCSLHTNRINIPFDVPFPWNAEVFHHRMTVGRGFRLLWQ